MERRRHCGGPCEKGGAESGLECFRRRDRRTAATRVEPVPLDFLWRSGLPAPCFSEGNAVRSRPASVSQSSFGTDAVDARQVDAGKAPQFGAQLVPAAATNRLFLDRIGMGGHGLVAVLHRLQRLDFLQDAFIGRDLALNVVEFSADLRLNR